MNIKQFLEHLSPDSEWTQDSSGVISDANEHCPIWNVYYDYYCACEPDDEEVAEDYVEAGRRCGLRSRDAIAIAQAADNRGRPRLRKRLLAAVGLADTQQPRKATP